MNSPAARFCDTTSLWDAYRRTKNSTVKMQLAMHYVDIARTVARQMRSKAVAAIEEDDLVQIGILGIGEAITHFDHSRGIQFETYAMLRARWAILDELRKLDWIPRYTREKLGGKQQESGDAKREKKIAAARALGGRMENRDDLAEHNAASNMFEMLS